jgi:hypothetical protein
MTDTISERLIADHDHPERDPRKGSAEPYQVID